MEQPNTMTNEEQRIWQSAFGTEFASRHPGSISMAIKCADNAVLALRRWRNEVNSAAGVIVEERED